MGINSKSINGWAINSQKRGKIVPIAIDENYLIKLRSRIKDIILLERIVGVKLTTHYIIELLKRQLKIIVKGDD